MHLQKNYYYTLDFKNLTLKMNSAFISWGRQTSSKY